MKPGRLIAKWSKKEKDILYDWGEGVGRCDAHRLNNALTGKTFSPMMQVWDVGFLEDMKSRGYDITTLKFSIEKKKP